MQNLNDIVRIAHGAGEKILEIYDTADFGVDMKADNSPLTLADLASHHYIVDALLALTPDIPILSEESKGVAYRDRAKWTTFWLVDPLDGTKEFIKRNGEFTVNIALIEDGVPILGVVHVPYLGVTYSAAKGAGAFRTEGEERTPLKALDTLGSPMQVVASRSHAGAETTAFLESLGEKHPLEVVSKGSALKLCLVAEGAADLYPRLGPTMEWDTAAAQAVVEQAGAQVTTLTGQPLRYNKENLLNPFFVVSSPATASLWQDHIAAAAL